MPAQPSLVFVAGKEPDTRSQPYPAHSISINPQSGGACAC